MPRLTLEERERSCIRTPTGGQKPSSGFTHYSLYKVYNFTFMAKVQKAGKRI